MRKITLETAQAFLDGKSRTIGNTSTDGTFLMLHGNIIAQRLMDGRIEATLANWPTITTRERLNGLCELLGIQQRFHQHRSQQFYGLRPISTVEWVILEG